MKRLLLGRRLRPEDADDELELAVLEREEVRQRVDLEAETAKLVGKGVKVIFSGTPKNGGAFAYFDTRKRGGDVMIKLADAD